MMQFEMDNPNNETISGRYRMIAHNGSDVVDVTEDIWFIGPNEEDWRIENHIENGSHITHYGLEMLPDES